MKKAVCANLGLIGSWIAGLFGGWDASLTTLLIFMGVDFITGLVVAGVFHNSPKTKNGNIRSENCFKGLCRKGTILLFVLIGARLDLVFGFNYVRDGICIAFMANELISITENAALMGVPLPKVLTTAIDTLKSKSESYDTKNDDNKEDF